MKSFRFPTPALLVLVASPLTMSSHDAWHTARPGVARSPAAKPTRVVLPRVERDYVGQITGWRIGKDGTVFFRLDSLDKNQRPRRLWFKTPPNQSATTRLERLILQAVLELQGITERAKVRRMVTVRGDDSNDGGKTAADALELVWLEHTS